MHCLFFYKMKWILNQLEISHLSPDLELCQKCKSIFVKDRATCKKTGSIGQSFKVLLSKVLNRWKFETTCICNLSLLSINQ